jgi:tRNA (guanine-N7-)-methyltransferase
VQLPPLDLDASGSVRTFKMRRSRVSSSQAGAIERLWPAYGFRVVPAPLDLRGLFGRVAPVLLEIGPGMGEATFATAQAHPELDVLAVDVHTPGHGNLLKLVEEAGLTNVRVGDGDALVLLREGVGPGSLAEVRALFPDPWPKARHHKRRLVTPAFAELVHDRLVPGGVLHVATDWADYAEVVREVLEASPLEVVEVGPRLRCRPETRFERQGLAAGRSPVDVVAVRQ